MFFHRWKSALVGLLNGPRRLLGLLALGLFLSTLSPLGSLEAAAAGQEEAAALPQEAGAKAGEAVFRVGLEANYAPFNWSQTSAAGGAYPIANSPGEYVNGYDLWMAKELASRLGMKLEVQKIEWDGLTPALMSGLIDAIVAGMSPTEERREQIDFTEPYYRSDLVLVLRKDSPYSQARSLKDFQGARVSGQLNTFHYTVIEQIPAVQRQAAMDSFPTLITAVKSGALDAYVSERPGAMAAVAASPELSYVQFPEGQGFTVKDEDVSIAVGLRKDSPLLPLLNQALRGIPEEERQAAMERMIALEQQGEASAGGQVQQPGFWRQTVQILRDYGPLFLRGAAVTLLISTVGTLLGFLLALIVQILRELAYPARAGLLLRGLYRLLQFLLGAYVEIFRGTPMMVQAVLLFYGSRLFFGWELSSLAAALIIVSVNTGAYLAEVIRGGIRAIDRAQFEACTSLGLSHSQSMRYVILPQTIRAILPAVGNEFVVNIKDTSVLNVISVTELFFATRSVAGSTYLVFQTYAITALIYFVLTFAATRLINYWGKKSGKIQAFSLSSQTQGGQEVPG